MVKALQLTLGAYLYYRDWYQIFVKQTIMLKHLGKIKIPSRITGRSLAYNFTSNPIDSLPKNSVNTRERSAKVGILWCWSVQAHYDYDSFSITTLLVLDSNQHKLSVKGSNPIILSRGDAIVFRNDYLHSLSRPNNRKALFCALFLDSEDKRKHHTLDDAKALLVGFA